MFPAIPIIREQDNKIGRGLTQPSPQSYEESKKLHKIFTNRRIPTSIDYTKQPYLLESPPPIPQARIVEDCRFPVFGWLFIIIMVTLILGILIGIR